MAQNIYDRPDFLEGYSRLPRSVEGLDGANEWPAMRALLPELRGSRVLDLGCGFGWFCRWAHLQGAASVRGIDVSARMLARAVAESPAEVTYQQADLETVELPVAAYDLAYSSLALHYVEDVGRLFRQIHLALAPGGSFVFSTEHPIFMAPSKPGWVTDPDGRTTWPLDRYLVEGIRKTHWFVDGVVKHHRVIGTTFTRLVQAGFTVTALQEFAPRPEQIAARPELAVEVERPMFLLMRARR
jgi:SAM-dependent methyltransferase